MSNIKISKNMWIKSLGVFRYFHKKEIELSLLILVIFLLLIFSLTTKNFFSSTNFMTILSNISIIGIISIGFAVVLINGNIDLSVGAITALTGTIIVFIIKFFPNISIWLIFLLCLIVGSICGAINGFFIIKLKLNTVISTLAMMSVIRGIAYLINAYYMQLNIGSDQGLMKYTRMNFFNLIPISSIYLLVILIIFIFILTRTKFGKSIYAIGDNINSARLMGIKTNKVQYLSFIISAICATIAGIILVGQLAIGRADNAVGSEFEALTIVILGGISVKGGKGNLIGVLFGMLIFAMITNGIVHLGLNMFWKEIAKGAILIIALSLETIRRRRSLFKIIT